MTSWTDKSVTNHHLLPYIRHTDPNISPAVAAGLQTLPFERNIFALLANAPAFFPAYMNLLSATWGPEKTIRASEWQVVVLRTVALLDAPYEWGVNEPLARILGFSDEKLAAIREGRLDGPEFTERQRVVARMVDELVEGDCVSVEGMMEGKRVLGDEGTMEVLYIQGIYALIARTMRSCRIDYDPEVLGLEEMLRKSLARVVERERREEEEDLKRSGAKG